VQVSPTLPVAIATVLCAVAIAACGTSSKSGAGAKNAGAAGGPDALRYAQCIRSHGVPDFPDPGTTGGPGLPSDVNPQSPAFKSAAAACAKLFPSLGGPRQIPESQKLSLLAVARCMRTHGMPNFPDPTFPSTGGIRLEFPPGITPQSPAFQQAATDCKFPVPRGTPVP
jgi:hypothetical protein